MMNNKQTDTCKELKMLVPAYVLGTLDSAEQQKFEQQRADCPDLEQEIATYQQMMNAMLMANRPVKPPTALHDKIMAAARQSKIGVVPSPSANKVTYEENIFRRYLFNPVAAALLLILIGSNLLWMSQVNTLTNQPPEIVMVTPTPMTDRLVYYQGEAGNNRVDIQDENAPGATLVWANRSLDGRWVGIFTTEGMTLPTDAETYQLWLIRTEEDPLSVGIFNVDEDGNGMIIFEVTEAIDTFDLVGVTLEPAGGSLAPTSDPIMAAEI